MNCKRKENGYALLLAKVVRARQHIPAKANELGSGTTVIWVTWIRQLSVALANSWNVQNEYSSIGSTTVAL